MKNFEIIEVNGVKYVKLDEVLKEVDEIINKLEESKK